MSQIGYSFQAMIFKKSFPLFLGGIAFYYFLKNGLVEVLVILMWITCSYGFFTVKVYWYNFFGINKALLQTFTLLQTFSIYC